MTQATSATTISGPTDRPQRGVLSFIETTKPGITRLVTITAAVGYGMAFLSPTHPHTWRDLALVATPCLVGTALAAAGANSINQWMERTRDARMNRTRNRPLPQGRISPPAVLWGGVAVGLSGVLLLLYANGLFPALLALACLLSYIAVYTPLKPMTTAATYIGTVPGALPPLIGWTAAAGWDPQSQWTALASGGGWALFAIMTAWQIPHFLAIGWMYKDDYKAGGYRVLPVVDPTGDLTARSISIWSLVLVVSSLMPALAMPDRLGWFYSLAALVLSVLFCLQALRLVRERTRDAARRVFFASIIYLPALLLAMAAEAGARLLLA